MIDLRAAGRARDFRAVHELRANPWRGKAARPAIRPSCSRSPSPRPQARIGGDESALHIDRRNGLLVARRLESVGNGDRIARALHAGEKRFRAEPGAGAVLAPFVAREAFAREDAVASPAARCARPAGSDRNRRDSRAGIAATGHARRSRDWSRRCIDRAISPRRRCRRSLATRTGSADRNRNCRARLGRRRPATSKAPASHQGCWRRSGAAVCAGFCVAPFTHLSSTQGVGFGGRRGRPRKKLSQKALRAGSSVGNSDRTNSECRARPIPEPSLSKPHTARTLARLVDLAHMMAGVQATALKTARASPSRRSRAR